MIPSSLPPGRVWNFCINCHGFQDHGSFFVSDSRGQSTGKISSNAVRFRGEFQTVGILNSCWHHMVHNRQMCLQFGCVPWSEVADFGFVEGWGKNAELDPRDTRSAFGLGVAG